METLDQLLAVLGLEGSDTELADHLAREDQLLMTRLVEARRASGLSQADMAERLEVSQASVSKFERLGNDPRLSTIRRYAAALGVSIRHHVDAEPDLSKVSQELWHVTACGVTPASTADAAFRVVDVENPWPKDAVAPVTPRFRRGELVQA